MLYNSLIYPYLHYGDIVWGNNYPTRLDKLFKVQTKVLRIITFSPYAAPSLPLFTKLRATASKYGESHDSSEISEFFLLRQKDPFGELFSQIYFQSSSEFTFL